MPGLIDDLEELRRQAERELAAADDPAALEAFRVAWLGRKAGRVTGVLRGLKDVPLEERAAIGDAANRLKESLTALFETKLAEQGGGGDARPAGLDYSRPGLRPPVGHTHLLTQTQESILDILTGMGFSPVSGPEVETVENNFDALNIGPEHPSRQPTDTFFFGPDVLLRTHTSPVQVRAMRAQEPPIRICCPGRVYRREAVDATHLCEFHQVEILYVDKGVTLRDLKGCLSTFARQMFGEATKTRLRPSYFPFVEPGAEVDVTCFLCQGSGCRVCKGSGWIEILGAGMVHPNVLRNVGYDPDVWTGYAAGMGVERITMLRHGVTDIRHFQESDLRFLEQF
ncbi:MAG TPA: phenylalanine--tRNA ligase subunit alpha [Candidatus Eisenbacteria bacterium]